MPAQTTESQTATQAQDQQQDPNAQQQGGVQAQDGAAAEQKAQLGPVETTDPLINNIQKQHPNGITLVIYGPTTKEMSGGYKNDNNNREFTTQAKGHAEIHKTVSVRGGQLNMGTAMMATNTGGVQERINTTYNTLIQRYRSVKPEGAPETPEHLKVKNLSLYYHGGQKQLYMPGTDLTTANVDDFVASVGDTLRGDVMVQLYACNAAKGDGSLSEVMAKELGGEANVLGHTTAAHTTENSNARVFGTLGDGTNMLDVMFPPAFVDAEVKRIWGDIADPAKATAARETLYARLKTYYRKSFGLLGGWDDPAKKAFEDADVHTKGYYASKGLKVPGRDMFLDPVGMSQEAQTRWMTYAKTNEAKRFAGIAPLSPDFGAGGGQTVRPEEGQAAPAREPGKGGGANAGGGGANAGGGTGGGGEGAGAEAVAINSTGAVRYNKSRPYTKVQWEQIQAIIGAGVDGVPGPATAQRVGMWQQQNGLEVDGYVGPNTFKKMMESIGGAAKQEDQPAPEGEAQKPQDDPNASTAEPPQGNVTANFSWSEFASRDGVPVPDRYKDNVIKLCQQLEVIRAEAGGVSIKINSGYRSPAHNKRVGGAKNSQHVVAKASDIVVEGKTPKQVKKLIERLIGEGRISQGGIGLYNSFVHYDIRGSAARW